MDPFIEEAQRSLGKLFRHQRRLVRNVSLKKFGESVGIDGNNLGRIERGEQLVDSKILLTLICELDLDSDFLNEVKEIYKITSEKRGETYE